MKKNEKNGTKLCFISYYEEHKNYAIFLEDKINKLFPETIKVLIASKSISPSSDWYKSIIENLNKAHCVIFLLAPCVVNRSWLLFEAGAAVALDKIIFPLRFCKLPTRMLPSPLTRFQSADLSIQSEVASWLEEMVTAKPPTESKIRNTARSISTYFSRIFDQSDDPLMNESIQQPIEYRIRLITRLSDNQRALFFYILTMQGDDGILESNIREYHFIPYSKQLPNQKISAGEYYFRLRELYHLGLLSMVKINPIENKWFVRNEIKSEIPPEP